jgi:hypothetical protein
VAAVARSFAYGVVTQSSLTLYIQPEKLTAEVVSHLGPTVTLRHYDDVITDLQGIAASATGKVRCLGGRDVAQSCARVVDCI